MVQPDSKMPLEKQRIYFQAIMEIVILVVLVRALAQLLAGIGIAVLDLALR